MPCADSVCSFARLAYELAKTHFKQIFICVTVTVVQSLRNLTGNRAFTDRCSPSNVSKDSLAMQLCSGKYIVAFTRRFHSPLVCSLVTILSAILVWVDVEYVRAHGHEELHSRCIFDG